MVSDIWRRGAKSSIGRSLKGPGKFSNSITFSPLGFSNAVNVKSQGGITDAYKATRQDHDLPKQELLAGRNRFPGGFEQALQEYGVVARAVPRLSRNIRIFARGNSRVSVVWRTYAAIFAGDQ